MLKRSPVIKAVLSFFLGAAWLLAAVPATPHHSFAAEFDVNRPVKLTALEELEQEEYLVYVFVDKNDKSVKPGYDRGAKSDEPFVEKRRAPADGTQPEQDLTSRLLKAKRKQDMGPQRQCCGRANKPCWVLRFK